MPERYGFRFGGRDRMLALRPIAASLGVFLVIGAIVLGLYESRNAARHDVSMADRAEMRAQLEANARQLAEVRQVAARAIAGHAAILAELKAIREAVEAAR